MSHSPCSICGGSLGAPLLIIRTPDRFERHAGISETGYERPWLGCPACGGATSLPPAPARQALAHISGSYYEIDLGGTSIAERHAKIMALPAARSDNAGRAQRVADRAAAWRARTGGGQPRLLDIGAGTGVFLARVLPLIRVFAPGASAIAVEPDPSAAAFLRSLGTFTVSEGLFTGQPELHGMDLVTLNKVLEHLPEPLPLLQAIRQALAPAGLAYIEVPDVLTIDLRKPDDNILGPLHHHLYSPRALSAILARAGLETLACERVAEPSGKLTVYAFACRPEGLRIWGAS